MSETDWIDSLILEFAQDDEGVFHIIPEPSTPCYCGFSGTLSLGPRGGPGDDDLVCGECSEALLDGLGIDPTILETEMFNAHDG